jgi:epoxyqueuosine reductase
MAETGCELASRIRAYRQAQRKTHAGAYSGITKAGIQMRETETSATTDSASRSEAGSSTGLTRERARVLALAAGFAEAGLVGLPYEAETRDASRFDDWVSAGRAGTMQYLQRTAENGELTRSRVGVPFPWARSAIVCFASYFTDATLSTKSQERGSAWIARYAWSSRVDADGVRRPSDYHKVLLKRVKAMEAELHAQFGAFEARGYVDTGPVVERALAAAAGVGWTGKNTCLIHPKLGSYGFLAVLLTSLEVAAKDRRAGLVADHCGTCTRCIDACPTNALDVPYKMDATRCIAYLTIEHKGPIAEQFAEGIGRQVFGCDICQDVCPWNRKAPIVADPELQARPELVNPALDWLGSLDEKSFEREFNGSPVRRASFNGLRRNMAIAMGNSGLRQFVPWLKTWAAADDEGLRAAAQWALDRLRRE